jgi:O-antigen/teichoic acid export membrane protein
MISFLKNRVQSFWNVGHERTLKIKRNIIYTFLIKGSSVAIGFLLIRLTIHYIDTSQYGIWLTISSLVAWMNTFDIGLSNGLRNEIAHSLALDEKENIVKYISTTYAILFLIALITFCVFLITGSFFDWNRLLNIQHTIDFNVWPIVVIALGSFCIQFFLQPINSVLIATHQPFKSSLILLLGQLLTFILTYLLTIFTQANLLLLVVVVAGSPVFVFLFANIYLFKTSLKTFSPKFRFVDFKSAKSLLNVGGVFFFIQIGALILFQTDNIVINSTLGPKEVTTFNIAYKYFSILTIVFAIIMTPYWSAFTEAYAKKDLAWIKQSVNKMRKLWIYLCVLTMLLYFFSNIFYKLWIGNSVTVPMTLSLSMAIYVIVQTWQVIHNYLLNGVGKLRIQLILVVTTGIINIPLSIFLINRIGISGTVVANIIIVLINDVFFTYQYKLIINQKATGIWNK